jgi:hypothetical protein
MSDQVVVSLGVDDVERPKEFFCEGLGSEIEQAAGPFAAFKESPRWSPRPVHGCAIRIRGRRRRE